MDRNKQEKDSPEVLHVSLQTRQEIQRKHKLFLNGRYQRFPDIDRLIIKRSFGSCGVPLEIYWDSGDEERAQAVLGALRQERFGITDKDKCCIFCAAVYAGIYAQVFELG